MSHQIREFDIEPEELVRALLSLESGRRLSLLDSCGVQAASFLIAGFDPFEVIEVYDGRALISNREGDDLQVDDVDALTLLDGKLRQYSSFATAEDLFFGGACIATLSYDLVHQIERLRSGSKTRLDLNEPDAVFTFYDTLVVHDYKHRKTTLVTTGGTERLDQTEEALRRVDLKQEDESVAVSSSVSNMTRDEYLGSVDRIKEYISAGDIYQANLTQRFTCTLPEDTHPENIFMRLRRDHPAPFAAFLRRREDSVISISPERFLRVIVTPDGRQVEAWPIKGTRPRGTSPGDDERLRVELQSSAKDLAENVMIVDLLRNDLGRVCRYGSVEVAELCEIEEHPTLFHLVSKIRGDLREDVTAGDLIRACFPCGSITGAPKIRAMEIIDELESVPRGLSMGAIGYFGFDGSIDLSVAIRTMTVRDNVARFNVGGGIVADSDPAQEYEESLLKASALFRALGAREY